MSQGIKKLTTNGRRIYILTASVCFVLVSILFTYFKPLNTLDYLVSDYFYQYIVEKKESDSSIKIISIDSNTVEKLGKFRNWSREETAKLVRLLNIGDNRPDVIAFGLDYHGKKDSEGDNSLIEVCREYSNVCISSYVETKFDKTKDEDDYPVIIEYDGETDKIKDHAIYNISDMDKITGLRKPYRGLLPYIKTGIINTGQNDDDGYVRSMVASISYDKKEYDSFPLMIYKMYLEQNGKEYKAPDVGGNNEFGINYSKNGSNFDVYSFYDVVNGNVSASEFDGSIVLVGDYTAQNNFNMPNRRGSGANEIELQANIINALLQNNTVRYAERWFLVVWYSLFAVLFFIATSYSSGLNTIFYSGLLVALQILISCMLSVWGYYIPLLRLIILIVSIAVVNLLASYIIVRRQRYSLEKVFKKYVDEQVVNEIVKDGSISASIGGTRKDIAVLFVDIRGFTPLSENLAPENVVDILNNYLTIVADAVAANGGTLDKFIGDAAMAVFNSPSDLDDYVFRAVCTAWDILSNAADIKRECLEKYGKEVEFGIGVNCGDAVIGNIGSQNRMEFTAIGDTVNTTSRLEGAAGAGQILISSEVVKRLAGRIDISFAGDYKLKGKKKRVMAYQVDGILEQYEPVKREKSIEEKYEESKNEIKKAHEKYANEIQAVKEIKEKEIKESIKEIGSKSLSIIEEKKQKKAGVVKGGQ